jgi:hypothetical protein
MIIFNKQYKCTINPHILHIENLLNIPGLTTALDLDKYFDGNRKAGIYRLTIYSNVLDHLLGVLSNLKWQLSYFHIIFKHIAMNIKSILLF